MGIFMMGLVLGLALGVLIGGVLAWSAYRRGYDDARLRRKEWRGELVARHTAAEGTLPTQRAG